MKHRTSRQHRDLGPNRRLIGKPRSRRALATPALILDLDVFEDNLKTMAKLCGRAGLNLRPHAKTHKSIEIARRQIACGAVGISVATLREATVMVEARLPGVLLTTPVAGAAKIEAFDGLALVPGFDLTHTFALMAVICDRVGDLSGDAEADEDHEAHRDEVGDGCALAGEDEDQRDGELRGGAGSDGGDGLGEGFERRESVVAEAEGLGGG